MQVEVKTANINPSFPTDYVNLAIFRGAESKSRLVTQDFEMRHRVCISWYILL